MASYEVRQIEGKGQGLVATKHITSGSLMLSDQPLLTVHSASSTNTDIEDAFCNVRKQDQDFYLTLYEGRSNYPHESKIVRIFNSNHFGTEQSKFVLPLIARLNNSCVANAAVIDSTLRAQKTIQVGEEITICYRETWDEVLTASQRNLMFKYRYDFTCSCKACLSSKDRWPSDRRRLLIGQYVLLLKVKHLPTSANSSASMTMTLPAPSSEKHTGHPEFRRPHRYVMHHSALNSRCC